MTNSRLIILLIFFASNFSIKAQNNLNIIKVYPTIGDTVDEVENTKYKLFDNFLNGQFKYAVYKYEKNNYNVYVTLKNGEIVTIPYSTEKILRDAEKIVASSTNLTLQEKLDENKPKWGINPSIVAGAWIPTGKLSKLGVHPNLGFQAEACYSKISIGIEFSCKFLNTTQPYLAKRVHSNKQIEATNHFFGGYFGLIGGYDLINTTWHRIRLIGGIAVDGFDVLVENKNLKSESIWASNFNLGVGYCYKFNKTKYIGLQVKYNHVDYTKSKIIDLTGQPITVIIDYGLFNLKKPKNKNK